MKYNILTLVAWLCLFTLAVPMVSHAWCEVCQSDHKDPCDSDDYSYGGSSSDGSSSYDIGQEANKIGQGGAVMVGSIAGVVTGIGVAAANPKTGIAIIVGSVAAFGEGAKRLWDGVSTIREEQRNRR